MGCSITIIKPEHRILDYCIEIGRLASITDNQNTNVDSSTSSTSSSNSDMDEQFISTFNMIINTSKECELLPQYCLREVRHAVETLNFKKPDVYKRLSKLCDSTISAVKQKTLGISAPYQCFYSPNEGNLKVDFHRLHDLKLQLPNEVSPSRAHLISPLPSLPPQQNQQPFSSSSSSKSPPQSPHKQFIQIDISQSPSKTPNITPTTTPRVPMIPLSSPPPLPLPSSSISTASEHKKMMEKQRRASCPAPSSTNRRSDFDGQDCTRVRLRSLDENDEDQGALVDYGFYHEDDQIFDV